MLGKHLQREIIKFLFIRYTAAICAVKGPLIVSVLKSNTDFLLNCIAQNICIQLLSLLNCNRQCLFAGYSLYLTGNILPCQCLLGALCCLIFIGFLLSCGVCLGNGNLLASRRSAGVLGLICVGRFIISGVASRVISRRVIRSAAIIRTIRCQLCIEHNILINGRFLILIHCLHVTAGCKRTAVQFAVGHDGRHLNIGTVGKWTQLGNIKGNLCFTVAVCLNRFLNISAVTVCPVDSDIFVTVNCQIKLHTVSFR